MSPDERVYFEQLRKSNPEIDQAVVEHTFFLQQMNRFDEVRKLKNTLSDAHVHLAEKGLIASPRLKGKARVAYLYNRYKRVAAIAATIAGITALTITSLVWSISPGKPAQGDIIDLERKFDNKFKEIKIQNDSINKKIEDVKSDQAAINDPVIQYKSGGTGFLLDVKGYVVTNAHVVENARHIAVQDNHGKEFTARTVYIDPKKDIAILKITSKNFKSPGALPYAIKKSGVKLAEPIYTLGFPRDEVVYGQGYIAAKTGYMGDSLALQITIAANQGNSGGPVLNNDGEIVGVLTGKQKSAEGAVFALQSKYIFNALSELQKDTAYQSIKIPLNSSMKGKERTQQVEQLEDFVYMVKVD
jgi:S1-C subfamily serine protease